MLFCPRDTLTAENLSITASFLYDGDGQRAQGTVNGVTTTYVGSHYEVQGTTTRKYYFAGTQRIAVRENAPSGEVLSYLLADHLGSFGSGAAAITVDASGTMTGELRYSAWGETRYTYGTTPTNRRYTGQSSEPDLGIMFYESRWYDPALGRFLSADTMIPETGKPTAWDRYAYTSNNPINRVDPTGHAEACTEDKTVCGENSTSTGDNEEDDPKLIPPPYGSSYSTPYPVYSTTSTELIPVGDPYYLVGNWSTSIDALPWSFAPPFPMEFEGGYDPQGVFSLAGFYGKSKQESLQPVKLLDLTIQNRPVDLLQDYQAVTTKHTYTSDGKFHNAVVGVGDQVTYIEASFIQTQYVVNGSVINFMSSAWYGNTANYPDQWPPP